MDIASGSGIWSMGEISIFKPLDAIRLGIQLEIGSLFSIDHKPMAPCGRFLPLNLTPRVEPEHWRKWLLQLMMGTEPLPQAGPQTA
jgi:hypothetical protein